jgi:ferredoxin-type protein NapF
MNFSLRLMQGLLKLVEGADHDLPLTRAQFLRGRVESAVSPLRPPWALPEPEFSTRCTGCGLCRQACPEKIIVAGGDSRPLVDFNDGGCSFCGACLSSCPEGALSREPRQSPWQLAVSISNACLAARRTVCRSCGEVCPVGAIVFEQGPGRPALPEIDRQQCTGCGICVSGCPAGAIVVAPEPSRDKTPRFGLSPIQ